MPPPPLPKAYRSSYTLINSQRFYPLFDKLLKMYNNPGEGKTYFEIPAHSYDGLSPSTFQNRFVDGLRYLVDNFDTIEPEFKPVDHSKEEYILLKHIAICRLPATKDRNILALKIHKSAEIRRTLLGEGPKIIATEQGLINIPEPSFQNKIRAYLEDSFRVAPEVFKDLEPTEADVKWINGLVAGSVNLEHFWNGRNLTIVKIK